MAKMPFIPDPRYSRDADKAYNVHRQIMKDQRKPYPPEHEIGLPRRNINEQCNIKKVMKQ